MGPQEKLRMLPATVPAAGIRGCGLREAVPAAGRHPATPGGGWGGLCEFTGEALFSGDPETDLHARLLQSELSGFLCWVVAMAFGIHFLFPQSEFTRTLTCSDWH